MKILKFLLFDGLGKYYLTNPIATDVSKRHRAMGLELVYLLSVSFPFIFPLVFFSIFFDNTKVGQTYPTDFQVSDLIPFILGSPLYFIIYNKDYFQGQSIINRLIGYQVVNIKTLQPASELRCMLRNITAPLWIIEGIVVGFHPQRRLGDFIAGTKLIEVEPSNPELILDEIRKTKIDIKNFMTLCTIFIVMMLFYYVLFEKLI